MSVHKLPITSSGPFYYGLGRGFGWQTPKPVLVVITVLAGTAYVQTPAAE